MDTSRRTRRRREHRVRRDRWLVSYADFITLMFAFFVVMYALSSTSEHKYRVLSESLAQAFNNASSQRSESTGTAADEDAQKRERSLQMLASAMQAALAPLEESGAVRIAQSASGITVEIGASALFQPAEAHLQPEGVEVLTAVAHVLKSANNPVRIEGHTDSLPISTPVFPSNWELSAARASAVARLFTEAGIDGGRIGVMGYADHRPVEGNDTPQGRARNRRVTLSVLAQS